MARYQTGIDPYIDVVTAQTTLLSDQQTLANLHTQVMTASVQLIEALGELPNAPAVLLAGSQFPGGLARALFKLARADV